MCCVERTERVVELLQDTIHQQTGSPAVGGALMYCKCLINQNHMRWNVGVHTHIYTHCPLESKPITSGSVVETESISWHMPSSHTSWARQRSCTVSLTSAVAVVPVARAREDGRRVLLEMCFRNAEHWYLRGWEQVPGGCPTERRCPRCCRSHPPPPVYAPDRGQRHISI